MNFSIFPLFYFLLFPLYIVTKSGFFPLRYFKKNSDTHCEEDFFVERSKKAFFDGQLLFISSCPGSLPYVQYHARPANRWLTLSERWYREQNIEK